MNARLLLLPPLVLSVLLCGQSRAEELPGAVDTLYHNGVIRPMTGDIQAGECETVDVLATRDGAILFAGNEAEARKRGLFDAARRIVDLKGSALLPGFVDGHGHFPEQGQYDLYEVNLNSFPLGTMTSIADYRQALAGRCAAAGPDDWVVGWGYDDTSITDMRHPAREDIDAVCPNNPVYLRHISGHMGAANSRALEKADLTPEHPEKLKTEGVVRDGLGRPTGLLMETRAMGLVTSLPDFPAPDMQKALARASHVYASRGVTTADQGASLMAVHLPLFQEGLRRGTLSLRVVLHPLAAYETSTPQGFADIAGWRNRKALGWREAEGEGKFRFTDAARAVPTGADITDYIPDGAASPMPETPLPEGRLFLGAWKLLFDGSPQGYTAWLKSPGYYDWGDYDAADSFDGAPYFNGLSGTLNLSVADVEALIRLYHRAGQSTETHTNGNAAAEAWVAALEKAVVAFPEREDTRHTTIHAQTLELQHIQRLTGNYQALEGTAKLYTDLRGAFTDGRLSPEAVGAPDIDTLSRLMAKQHFFSSYFIDHVYFWGERHRNIFLGPGRADNMSPAGWSVYYRQPYAFHSDAFVTPIHPLRSVQTALMRLSGPTPLSPGGTLISGTGRDIRATVALPARDPAQTETVETGLFPNFDQRIGIHQALLGVTRLPARQNKLETRFGSLKEGLAADFVILEKDPVAVAESAPEELASLRVLATVVGDTVVYGLLPDDTMAVSAPLPSYIGNDKLHLTMRHCAPAPEKAPLSKDARMLGSYAFRASAEGKGTPVFQMDMSGPGGKVGDLRLFALDENGARRPFVLSEHGTPERGRFQVVALIEPTTPLGPNDVLKKNVPYMVLFSPAQTPQEDDASCDIRTTVLLEKTLR